MGLNPRLKAKVVFRRLNKSFSPGFVSTGEESGTLDRTLETLAQHYDSELEQRLRSLQVSLRGLSLVVMGCLVAVVGVRGISVLLDSFPE
ncbi:MAG: type II secretion system F family protein [Coleofasciculus sp. C1-SOL-03]|uniref:type II secretion system F family protein n=1 Tax=Coleofasciculus sp. C1-SOL-03 TaxID=3069522 RepID=UPI0033027CD3